MLHRYKLWLCRTWDKLPVLLSLAGWPPLLSHGLAFIIGTLLLRPAGPTRQVPAAKILIPLDRLARIDKDVKTKSIEPTFTLLQKQNVGWCRMTMDPLAQWTLSTKAGGAFLLWPASPAAASKLEQLLLKKIVITSEPHNFIFCQAQKANSEKEHVSGVSYD